MRGEGLILTALGLAGLGVAGMFLKKAVAVEAPPELPPELPPEEKAGGELTEFTVTIE